MSNERRLVLESVVGSTLHRLNDESSDVDLVRVWKSPLHVVLSPFYVERGKNSGDTDANITNYELRHFLRLLAHGNPTALEVLWSDLRNASSGIDADLMVSRKKFLDSKRIYEAHRGYARQQLRKLNEEGMSDRRRGKCMAAYLRVLSQGAQVLLTGTFSPKVIFAPERLRELKMGVSLDQMDGHWFFTAAESANRLLEETYAEYPDQFVLDREWVEHFTVRCYGGKA